MRPSKHLIIGTCILGMSAIIGVGTTFAIRQGTPTNDLLKTVMALKAEITVDGNTTHVWGTATNITYPRCFVTAAHNFINPLNGGEIGDNQIGVVQGQHPATGSGGVKFQLLANRFPHGEFDVQAPMWADIAVFQVEKEAGANRLQKADYAPIEYGGDLGPANTTYTGATFGSGAQTTGHRDVDIMGYGAFSGSTMMEPTKAMGLGHKRKGVAHARNLVSGSLQNPVKIGGFYTVVPTSSGGQLGCYGDSGGPLFKTNDTTRTYGVLVGTTAGSTCNAATYSYYTAIDELGTQTMKAWVKSAVTAICATELNTSISPSNTGKVTGTLEDDPDIYPGDPLVDGDIACGTGTDGDCKEMVHDGEWINLTATANSGYSFYRWEDGLYHCPCNGSSSVTCNLAYDDLGTYGVDISVDKSDCKAVFVMGGGGSSSSMGP